MISKLNALILCILGPYFLGVIGNASFVLFNWCEGSRWILGIIALLSFTIVSFAMKTPVKPFKGRL